MRVRPRQGRGEQLALHRRAAVQVDLRLPVVEPVALPVVEPVVLPVVEPVVLPVVLVATGVKVSEPDSVPVAVYWAPLMVTVTLTGWLTVCVNAGSGGGGGGVTDRLPSGTVTGVLAASAASGINRIAMVRKENRFILLFYLLSRAHTDHGRFVLPRRCPPHHCAGGIH